MKYIKKIKKILPKSKVEAFNKIFYIRAMHYIKDCRPCTDCRLYDEVHAIFNIIIIILCRR